MQKIPGLTTAMFSIFEPGKHLPAHRGPYNGVLRLHLGLIVPEPNDKLAIRVDKQICHWQEGKALIFDDAYEHEAWNHSDKTRELISIAVAITTRCDGCIGVHTDAAIKAGATREEIAATPSPAPAPRTQRSPARASCQNSPCAR